MPRYQTAQASLGPENTPAVVRWLILLTAGCSIFAAITEDLFQLFLGIHGLQHLFSLSSQSPLVYLLWQPVTYLFVCAGSITFWWLVSLFFNLYILWVIGSYLVERMGSASFVRMYLFTGASAGLITLLVAKLGHSYIFLAGPTAPIFALLVVWAMINPQSMIFLFFIIPIKAHVLVTGLIGILALLSLSSGDWTGALLYLSGAAIGYLYAVMGWELKGPYRCLHRFDEAACNLSAKVRRLFCRKNQKIISIKAAQSRDEQFMNRMLEKISKKGINSLTFWERWRMSKISKKD